MINFVETRLELGVNYGVIGGISFKTEIIEKADEQEQRNSVWYLPLGRWQLGEKSLLESEIEQIYEVEYLRRFHADRLGSMTAFRFKDWCDFFVVGQSIGIGDGLKTQWQLKKSYWAGTTKFDRPIVKPVEGTVKVYVDGVDVGLDPHHDWSVNHVTGIISKLTPLETGKEVTADFEFDVPVFFEQDDISWELKGYESQTKQAIYSLGSLFVKEIRILPLVWEIEPIERILQPLDLGINYETTETIKYNNSTKELSSGWTQKYNDSEIALTTINLSSKLLSNSQFINILSYFYCAKGSCLAFDFIFLNQILRVRFKQDSLSLKFEAKENNTLMFLIQNLELVQAQETTFSSSTVIDKETYLITLIDTSGSMTGSIPAITNALNNLRSSLQSIYGSEEEVNKYYKNFNFSSEDWVNQLSLDRRVNSEEPDKICYLVWINEANPLYHNSTSHSAPTSSYLTHLNNFLSSYNNRIKFNAIIYSVYTSGTAFQVWQQHLLSAYEGSNYPVALKNYNIQIKLDVPESQTAETYLNDFRSFLGL